MGLGEKDALNKLRHSVQFPIHPCDVQVETTLRRQAAFLSPASPAMCKAACLQGGHEQFLGPPCSQKCTCTSLRKKAVLISSGVIPTSFAIVSLTFKMPVELRRNEHAPPPPQRADYSCSGHMPGLGGDHASFRFSSLQVQGGRWLEP